MQVESLSWFPGHMTKTRRMIAAEIGHMDAVCEILDARIPLASRNPDVDELTAGKPRLVVLNRVDQADPEGTKRWAEHFRAKGYAVLESDAKSGVGTAKFAGAVRELLADKLRAYALQEEGMDTLDANVALGMPADARSYATAAQVLRHLGVRSVELMTNNPDKVAGLERYGVSVRSMTPTPTFANGENLDYLRTKRDRMGHLLNGLDPTGADADSPPGETRADDDTWHTSDENEGEER